MIRNPNNGARLLLVVFTVGLASVDARRASAQPPVARPAPAAPTGTPPPALPDTIARDDDGRATVRAVRVTTPMRIDGRLDEGAYSSVQPASGFIQMEPKAGQAASEKTEEIGRAHV